MSSLVNLYKAQCEQDERDLRAEILKELNEAVKRTEEAQRGILSITSSSNDLVWQIPTVSVILKDRLFYAFNGMFGPQIFSWLQTIFDQQKIDQLQNDFAHIFERCLTDVDELISTKLPFNTPPSNHVVTSLPQIYASGGDLSVIAEFARITNRLHLDSSLPLLLMPEALRDERLTTRTQILIVNHGAVAIQMPLEALSIINQLLKPADTCYAFDALDAKDRKNTPLPIHNLPTMFEHDQNEPPILLTYLQTLQATSTAKVIVHMYKELLADSMAFHSHIGLLDQLLDAVFEQNMRRYSCNAVSSYSMAELVRRLVRFGFSGGGFRFNVEPLLRRYHPHLMLGRLFTDPGHLHAYLVKQAKMSGMHEVCPSTKQEKKRSFAIRRQLMQLFTPSNDPTFLDPNPPIEKLGNVEISIEQHNPTVVAQYIHWLSVYEDNYRQAKAKADRLALKNRYLQDELDHVYGFLMKNNIEVPKWTKRRVNEQEDETDTLSAKKRHVEEVVQLESDDAEPIQPVVQTRSTPTSQQVSTQQSIPVPSPNSIPKSVNISADTIPSRPQLPSHERRDSKERRSTSWRRQQSSKDDRSPRLHSNRHRSPARRPFKSRTFHSTTSSYPSRHYRSSLRRRELRVESRNRPSMVAFHSTPHRSNSSDSTVQQPQQSVRSTASLPYEIHEGYRLPHPIDMLPEDREWYERWLAQNFWDERPALSCIPIGWPGSIIRQETRPFSQNHKQRQ